MNPAEYIRAYTEPFASESASAPAELPFLPSERYYSTHEPAHYMYSFAMERLTRDELLRVVREMGLGEPENVNPGQLLGWIRDKDRVINDQGALLVEREQRLAAQDRLLGSRSYRLACRLMLIPRAMRRISRITRLPGR